MTSSNLSHVKLVNLSHVKLVTFQTCHISNLSHVKLVTCQTCQMSNLSSSWLRAYPQLRYQANVTAYINEIQWDKWIVEINYVQKLSISPLFELYAQSDESPIETFVTFVQQTKTCPCSKSKVSALLSHPTFWNRTLVSIEQLFQD